MQGPSVATWCRGRKGCFSTCLDFFPLLRVSKGCCVITALLSPSLLHSCPPIPSRFPKQSLGPPRWDSPSSSRESCTCVPGAQPLPTSSSPPSPKITVGGSRGVPPFMVCACPPNLSSWVGAEPLKSEKCSLWRSDSCPSPGRTWVPTLIVAVVPVGWPGWDPLWTQLLSAPISTCVTFG